MKKTRIALIVGAGALGLIVLSACGGSASSTNLPKATFKVAANTPSWKTDKSSANLTWYVNYDWFAQKWGKDVATKDITADTHTNITYQAGDDDKLNSMMASGKLPDIITLDATDTALISKASQWAYPLNELSKQYDPYFMSTAAKPSVLSYYTQSDSNVYGYPSWATTQSDYDKGAVYGNEALMVRKDIYDKIGDPSLKTPQDVLSALKAVQKLGLKDGAGNKIIPFGTESIVDQATPQMVSDTIADLAGIPTTKDGKYYDRYTDPVFKTWMSTLNEAEKDGLTSPDLLTMNGNTNTAQLQNGSYFMYLEPNINNDEYTLTTPGKYDYITVDGMNSTAGNKPTIAGPNMQGWTMTFISKKCKNPQKAMELLEYMVSPYGDTVMNFGKLGVSYNMVNGMPTLIPAYSKLKQDNPQKYEDTVGLGEHPWVQDSALLNRQVGLTQFPAGVQQAKQWTTQFVTYEPEMANLNNQLDDVAQRNLSKINTNWSQTFAKILTAGNNSAIDSAYSAYDSYKNSNGWSTIEKERNKQIDYNNSHAK